MTDTQNIGADDVGTLDAPTPFTTLPADQHPGGVLPDGVMYVTTEEMAYLKAMSWGADTWRTSCEACGEEMIFEKHPADWPNHPGQPGDVRVKIECPRCGHMQYTDGKSEVDYVDERRAELTRQVSEEVAARLQAESGSTEPVVVEQVSHTDGGSGGDNANGA